MDYAQRSNQLDIPTDKMDGKGNLGHIYSIHNLVKSLSTQSDVSTAPFQQLKRWSQ